MYRLNVSSFMTSVWRTTPHEWVEVAQANGFGLRGRGFLVQASMQRKHRWCSKPLSKVLKQQMLKWGPAMIWQLIQGRALPLPICVPNSWPQKGVIYSQPLTPLVLWCKIFKSAVCNSNIRLHRLTCGCQVLPLSQCFKYTCAAWLLLLGTKCSSLVCVGFLQVFQFHSILPLWNGLLAW